VKVCQWSSTYEFALNKYWYLSRSITYQLFFECPSKIFFECWSHCDIPIYTYYLHIYLELPAYITIQAIPRIFSVIHEFLIFKRYSRSPRMHLLFSFHHLFSADLCLDDDARENGYGPKCVIYARKNRESVVSGCNRRREREHEWKREKKISRERRGASETHQLK